MIQVLLLAHHAELTVAKTDDFDGQAILQTGHQLLAAHLDVAVAADTDDCLARVRQGRADRCWQSEPHRAETAGIDPAPRLAELEVLGRPHQAGSEDLSIIASRNEFNCANPYNP